MNILSALAGLASGARPGASVREGAAETPFAALLNRLGGETEVAREAEGPELAALLEDAETALADPEITDEELAEAFAPLFAALQGESPKAAPPLVQRLAEVLEVLRAGQDLPPEAEGVDMAMDSEGAPEIRAELTRLVGELSSKTGRGARPGEPVLRNDPAEMRVQAGPQSTTRAEAPPLAATESPPEASQDAPDAPPVNTRPDPRAALAASVEPRTAPHVPTDAPAAAQVTAPTAVSAPAPAQSPQPVARAPLPDSSQILNQLRAHVDEGGTIRVALRPEGLGRVEISLVPGDDGQLSVTVKADQASVLGSLRADREGLLTLLRDAGHQIDARSLNFGDLDGGGSETSRQPGQQTGTSSGQQGRETALPAWVAPDIPDIETSPQVTPASGAVDITV